jgi:hypothetical protein
MPSDLDLGPALWVLCGSVLALLLLRALDALGQLRLRQRTRQAIERALEEVDPR